jgi:Protein of unknown function DUF2625
MTIQSVSSSFFFLMVVLFNNAVSAKDITLHDFSVTDDTTSITPSIDHLINNTDPAWTKIKMMIDSAANPITILPVDSIAAKDALFKLQVTTRSSIGALVFMTGGLLIDNGWIRILGSGNSKLQRTLPDWNIEKGLMGNGKASPYLLVADDALGGFFLLNGGGLGSDKGMMYYFAPENLEFEPMEMNYTEFLDFCFNGDLDLFYGQNRFANWKEEVAKLNGDMVYNFYPTLWSLEGLDINANKRTIVPVTEQWTFNMTTRSQLGLDRKR